MLRSTFFSLFWLIAFSIIAQNKHQKEHLTFECQLVVDNDVFTLDLAKDQYYSSGIYPSVRFLMDSTKNTKNILSFQLNHRIYTPSWIGWEQKSLLDRPYAGIASVSSAWEFYFHKNQYLKTHLELGWMGPAINMGGLQKTYHGWFGMPEPKGWKYQINDTPVINTYLTYIKPFFSSYRLDLSTETNLSLGTIYNNVRQELMIRTGQLRPIHQSAYVSSFLGDNRRIRLPEPKLSEFYMFYSPGVEYVFHNATLEGSSVGKASVYTVDAINWVVQHRAGVMFAWPRYDLSFIYYWRSQENETATTHSYVGIRMNQRF
ncbi:MAG: lipid A deacylase LpxR family protein [Marinoscillum sp.]